VATRLPPGQNPGFGVSAKANQEVVAAEHVLLGLLEEPGSSAAELLTKLGVVPAEVRQALLEAIQEKSIDPVVRVR
jgi:ATP-dependent Clp protease ATP-binding subunit ClpA